MRLGCRKPLFNSWVGKICWRSDKPLTLVFLGFPGGSAGKESTCNAQDLGSIPGLGRSPGKGKGYPLQYFGLENSMDYAIHGVTKRRTRLSNFHFASLPVTFVIAFLPRSKHLLMSCLQSPSAVILEPKKIQSVTVSIVSPYICQMQSNTRWEEEHLKQIELM